MFCTRRAGVGFDWEWPPDLKTARSCPALTKNPEKMNSLQHQIIGDSPRAVNEAEPAPRPNQKASYRSEGNCLPLWSTGVKNNHEETTETTLTTKVISCTGYQPFPHMSRWAIAPVP